MLYLPAGGPLMAHFGHMRSAWFRLLTRAKRGRAADLTQFGLNICTLKPGAASSQRYWHENEDELVYVLEGSVVVRRRWGERCSRRARRRPGKRECRMVTA